MRQQVSIKKLISCALSLQGYFLVVFYEWLFGFRNPENASLLSDGTRILEKNHVERDYKKNSDSISKNAITAKSAKII